MLKNFVSILLLAISVSTFGTTTYQCKKNSNGQYTVKLDNISPYNAGTVYFRNKSTGQIKEIQIKKQTNITYNVSNKLMHWDNPDENNYVLEIIIPMREGRTDFHRECNYRPNANGSSTQNKNYHSENKLSDTKIKNYADQQARTTANNIIATYGIQEQYKANFVKGLNAGYGRKWNTFLDVVLDLTDDSYENGRRKGIQKAENEGYLIGHNAAIQDARSIAKREVERRNRQAAVKNTSVSQVISVPNNSFNSRRLSHKLFDISSELRKKIDSYQLELIPNIKKIDFNFDELDFSFSLEKNFSLYQWITLNGSYKFFKSYFAEDHALDEWKNNRLKGRYDYALYNKMDFLQTRQFEQAFKQTYNEVIKAKLANKISEHDDRMYDLGVSYGKKIYKEEAFLRGMQKGFSETIRNAAEDIYNETFSSTYINSFKDEMDDYMNNAILDNFSASLNSHQDTLGIVSIQAQVLNIGGRPALNQKIYLNSESFSNKEPHIINIIPAHGMSHFNFELELTPKKPIIADTSYEIKIVMGNHSKTGIVSLAFSDLVKLWIDTNSKGVKNILKQSIVKTITTEWYNNCGVFQTDIYKKSLEDNNESYLGEIVKMQNNGYPELNALYSDLLKANRWMSTLHFNKNANYKLLLNQLK